MASHIQLRPGAAFRWTKKKPADIGRIYGTKKQAPYGACWFVYLMKSGS